MSTEIQFACFRIGDEIYAADIMMIKEIILCRKVTHVPKAPDFVEGIINLRGAVIPIIDMRKRLELPVTDLTKDSRIVVIDLSGTEVGLIVDSVAKISRVQQADIRPAPAIIKGIGSEYLKGVVWEGDNMVLILDLDLILTTTEKVRLDNVFSSDAIPGGKS